MRLCGARKGRDMAIQIFCTECKTSNGLDAKKCSKCGTAFGRSRKYRVRVQVKGRRVTRVVDNLTIARDVEAAFKGDLVRDEFDIADHKVQEKPHTLADVWDKFLPGAMQSKKSWETDRFYYEKHIKPRFGSKALEEISSFEIESVKAEMKRLKTPQGKQGYSDASIRHVLVLLSHLFKKGREWKMYKGENPCESVRKPKLDNEITEFLTGDEMRRLNETLDLWPCKQSANFVRIAMLTGLRKSEIRKLTWDNVDLERKTLTVRDPKGRVTTTIPLSDRAVSVFLNVEQTSCFVLPGPDGGMKKTFRNPWDSIKEAAGLPKTLRFHGLRHNFASHLVSNGVDLHTVGKLLTHKEGSTVSTQRYAHLTDEALRRAAQKSGELLTPKMATPAKVVNISGPRKE